MSPGLANAFAFTRAAPRVKATSNLKPAGPPGNRERHVRPSDASLDPRASSNAWEKVSSRSTSAVSSPSSASARDRVKSVSSPSSSARAVTQTSPTSIRSRSSNPAKPTSSAGVKKSDQ